MKKLFVPFLALFCLFLFSGFFPLNTEHDSKLVGIWKGSETNRQIDGIEKHWILERFENGKYVIMFTIKEDCDIRTSTEKGEWWTNEGKYFERSGSNSPVDIYNYEIKNNKTINFRSVKLNGVDKSDYNFSDFKVDFD